MAVNLKVSTKQNHNEGADFLYAGLLSLTHFLIRSHFIPRY